MQCSIFVSRLPAIDNIEEALQRHFSPDGPIKNCRVMSSKANPGNKFAFVNFEDAPSAQKALLRHGQFFMGKSMIVSMIYWKANKVDCHLTIL